MNKTLIAIALSLTFSYSAVASQGAGNPTSQGAGCLIDTSSFKKSLSEDPTLQGAGNPTFQGGILSSKRVSPVQKIQV